MARRHYHVLCGMPGYMPDDNMAHTSRRAAEAEAAELARQCRDDGLRVTGSARDGYDVSDPASLAYSGYIEITDCYEDDCYNEDGALWQE